MEYKSFLCTTVGVRQLSSQRVLGCLRTWQSRFSEPINLFVHAKEERSIRRYLKEHHADDIIRIHLYGSLTDDLLGPPSLMELWSLFHNNTAKRYVFFNSDLELDIDNRLSAEARLEEIDNGQNITFFCRYDYHEATPEVASVYESGFDVFVIPSSLLDAIVSKRLGLFSIGNVGWDYFLPLSIRQDIVRLAYGFPVRHMIHPTGSSKDWGSMIVRLLLGIDESWIDLLPKERGILLRLCIHISKMVKGVDHTSKDLFRKALVYGVSRCSYYVCLRPLLKPSPWEEIKICEYARTQTL